MSFYHLSDSGYVRRFLIFIALFCGLSAASQTENTRPMWGIRAALDLNIPGKWYTPAGNFTMYRPGLGGNIGAVYNVYLGRGFYLEPGLLFYYDRYSYKDLILSDINGETESDPVLYKAGIRIPVVVGFSFNISENFLMSVYTGPEMSYAFTGDVVLKNANLDDIGVVGPFGENGYHRRVDCAWKVGFGFPSGMWFVSLDAAIGMSDLIATGVSFRENRCTLGVTRYF